MNWSDRAEEKTDLGSGKVWLYKRIQGLPETCAMLEITREVVRNAIDQETAQCLTRGLDLLDQAPEIRVLVVTGQGRKAFISGGDLKEYSKLKTEVDVLAAFAAMRQVLWRMYTGPRFTVALINGTAVGGGAEVASACHYRLQSEHASMGFIQVNQGISTGWGGATLLTERLGNDKAQGVLASGAVYTAKESSEWGLVDEIVYGQEQTLERLQWLTEHFGHKEFVRNRINADKKKALLSQMKSESEQCAALWFSEEHLKILTSYS